MRDDIVRSVPNELPTGTVTFLLTDVEGSTVLWEEHPDAMRRSMALHHRIVHDAIERHAGARPRDQGEGDSVLGAFARATDAVAAALDIQRGLLAEDWPEAAAIVVRAAIHTGEIELRDDNYFGVTLNRCARLRAIAHGGQTLVSQAAHDLVGNRLPAGTHFKSLGQHRLKDLALPENVYELVHEDASQEFPPLRSLDALPNNLPVQLTLFIGRDKEVGEVAKLLLANRLVTLTGAGGCGKTRLALQASAEILENYPDGAWFVDLAAISDPELVPMGFAKGLGLKTEASSAVDTKMDEAMVTRPENLIHRLKDYIRDRRMLLIVDNCEHLISASAEIINVLLRGSPSLSVLSTTREPLGVEGEATYRVPSLTVPDEKQPAIPEELTQYEAVRLFLHRASLVHDQFTLTDENANAVAQICRRLDGIPLAIELAAARVKSLGPGQIAARLDDQFRLLTGGSRTALERQQTLRAAVDWSYQLLSDQERRLLMRLSVFVGGFTLEAAEEVCADEALASHEVLDLVSQLVDKSLVAWESGGPVPRYRQLETIRQYAREKLLESGEGSAVRTRHRDFFMNLAEKAGTELEGRNVAGWLRILDLEIDNVRAAIEWSLSGDDPEPGIRIAGALSTYWDVRGYGTEARNWLDVVLAKEGEVAPALKSRALRTASFFARGNREVASKHIDEALALARQSGDDATLARAMVPLGMSTAYFKGDFDGALSVIQEAASLAHSAGDTYWEALCMFLVGELAIARGDHLQARTFFESSLAMARSIGTPLGIARGLLALAGIADHDRDYQEEKRMLEEALGLARQTGDTESMFLTLIELSRLAGIRGEDSLSSELWDEANRAVRESGDLFWLQFLARSAASRGSFSEALSLYQECLTRYREIDAGDAAALMLNNAGWMAYMLGDLETAHALVEEAVSMVQRPGAPALTTFSSMHSLGEIKRARGDLTGALPYLQEALDRFRDAKIKQGETECLISLAAVARAQGDVSEATSLLAECVTIAHEGRMVATILEAVAGLMVEQNKFEDATRLFSAADVLRELRDPVGAVTRASIDLDLRRVRAEVEPHVFEKVWRDGRSMDIKDALQVAERLLKAESG